MTSTTFTTDLFNQLSALLNSQSTNRLQFVMPHLTEIILFSVDEVAQLLGVSRKILDKHIHSGDLRGVQIGCSKEIQES